MIRRAVLVAAAAAALVLAPSAALAYNAPGFSSSVSDSTPAVGQSTTVTVQGGLANANKVITLVVKSGATTKTFSATANASGVATFTFTLGVAGNYTVQAFSAAGALVSDQVLTVAAGAAAAAPGGKLSATGFDGLPLAVGGGALVLAGAGAVVIARRRKTVQVHA